jgi:hypothetical protein
MPISFLIEYTSAASDTDIYSRFPWIFYYHIVANANVLINGIDKAEGSVAEKNAIKGKLWFIELLHIIN